MARLTPQAGRGLVASCALLNVVLGVLPVLFIVATSVLLGRIPAAAAGDGWTRLAGPLAAAAGAIIALQVLNPVQTALGDLIARRVDGQVFQRMMTACLRGTGLASIEAQSVQNDLAECRRELEQGFQSPGRACAGLLALLARYIQLAGYTLAVAVSFSWWAAAGVFLATMGFRYGQRGGLRKYSALVPRLVRRRRKADYLRDLASGVSAGKEIRVFGLVDWLAERYREAYDSWMRPVWAERRRIYLMPFLWLTLAGLALAGVVLAGLGATFAAGEMSLTEFALVAQVALAALRLGEHYAEADVQTQFGMNAYDAVRRLEAKMAAHDEPVPAARANGRLPAGPATIRFDNVSFAYPGHRRLVFDRLDLTIPAGRCTALVGLNGAGKTTLVKLLARLYEPTSGAVLVGGVDLRAVPVQEWRRRLGVVFQDFVRYEASAADNIGFGAVEHLDDLAGIAEAARAAGAADTVAALPLGPATPLARHLAGGVDLSGGQWQRLAIARVLFALRHGASVLVLDEPTASLDVRSEARFYDEFVRLTQGVTTLLISHRFATVRHADHIVVLEEGRAVEQGTHDELLRLGGRYDALFRLQAMRFSDETDQPEVLT